MKLDNNNKLRDGIILAILIFYAEVTYVIFLFLWWFIIANTFKCVISFFLQDFNSLLSWQQTFDSVICWCKKYILLFFAFFLFLLLNFFSQNILRFSYVSFCVLTLKGWFWKSYDRIICLKRQWWRKKSFRTLAADFLHSSSKVVFT